MRNVVVLGSTGSVGVSALDVITSLPEELAALGLSAHRRWQELWQQAEKLQPLWVALTDPEAARQFTHLPLNGRTTLLTGPEGAVRMATDPQTDIVLTAIVGSAGLESTWAALEAGKTVALANKETLVVAGPLIMDLARQREAALIPVDSEHSAILQAKQAGQHHEVRRVVLTASGGPFRTWSLEQLKQVTPEQALRHPTWQMGPKITIDSATLMNKALEVIEARWLFDLSPDQIEVVIHPESVVHSMVEFTDGSVVMQASPPDMRLPIQYALTYPSRLPSRSPLLDWKEQHQWHFEPPDWERFPALALGYEVARRGGTAGAVLNAANETAVERFLTGQISFADIPRACRATLDQHTWDPQPTLEQLWRLDRWARQEVKRWRSS